MGKPDLLVHIQKLQLSHDQEKEQRIKAEEKIQVIFEIISFVTKKVRKLLLMILFNMTSCVISYRRLKTIT